MINEKFIDAPIDGLTIYIPKDEEERKKRCKYDDGHFLVPKDEYGVLKKEWYKKTAIFRLKMLRKQEKNYLDMAKKYGEEIDKVLKEYD